VFLDLDVPADNGALFERAVDACAFLVWRVAERDTRLRFRTQEFDASIPEAGDVYTILRYLATVSALPGKPPVAPGNEESYQLVFTASDPDCLSEAGWGLGRIVGPDALPGSAADSEPRPSGGGQSQH
jgi:hypothetical protein